VFSKFRKIARVANGNLETLKTQLVSEINPYFYEEPLRLLVYNIEGKVIEKMKLARASNCALNLKKSALRRKPIRNQ
jgi:hypothetical protein